ncbi:MAG: selenide, water dikinase SelD [Candidatus Neomarinimicrobiota bacterium]|nr:selenide, water dikinase SelD [Candidatus Neomarinimicrobiota bacterium]
MGPDDLAQVLGNLVQEKDDRVIVGYDNSDDAAVIRLLDNKFIIQTVDFFTPIIDDPYMFGQIAAANAISDIYAMGGKPLFALNILGFPVNDFPKDIISAILQGGADKANEAEISIVGGHSIDDKEPKYGLVVTGEVLKDDLIQNKGAKAGDVLLLTKPLGTGIISTGIKKEIARSDSIKQAIESMALLNKLAGSILTKFSVNAATDVTGFGLLGHGAEICRSSNVSFQINYNNLTFFPGVKELAKEGIIPGGTKKNLLHAKQFTSFSDSLSEFERLMVADAQTSGGLLISLPQDNAKEFLEYYNNISPIPAVQIGSVFARNNSLITIS